MTKETLTVLEIINGFQALKNVANPANKKVADIEWLWSIKEQLDELKPHVTRYEEQRAERFKVYSIDGARIAPEKVAKFTEDIKKLQEVKVEVNTGKLVTLEKLKEFEIPLNEEDLSGLVPHFMEAPGSKKKDKK